MPDLRTEPRISENHPLSWSTSNGDFQGKARIRNISRSGMMLESDNVASFEQNSTLVFDSGLNFDNFVPREGEVVWKRNKNPLSNRQLWGVKFVEPTGVNGEYLNVRIDKKIRSNKVWSWVKGGTSVLLVLLSIAIISYTGWLIYDVQSGLEKTNQQLEVTVEKQSALTRNFANLYIEFRNLYNVTKEQLDAAQEELKTTKRLYEESQQMLAQVTQELDSTKSILIKTQDMISGMLEQVGIEATTSLDESQLMNKQTEFETAVSSLQERNLRLAEELNLIKQQLMYYAGEVKDINEAQAWFKMYRDRVKKVKQRIKVFRQQTQTVKYEAQGELDRIKSSLGNNGYFVRDGKVIKVDQEQYDSITLEKVMQQKANTTPTEPKNVEIDVNFFK